jgi:hypothetical protein
MKTRLIILASIVVVLLALWFVGITSHHDHAITAAGSVIPSENLNPNTPAITQMARTQSVDISSIPRLFKSTNYPPQTAEEKAQWDWWRAMRKTDPSFEWKIPIEFYGKVIDQFSNGVAGATVDLGWTTVIGPSPDPERTILSGPDGRFSITGIQGRRLTVSIRKEGYVYVGKDSIKSFEYAEFFDNLFHVPDPNNAVIFRLHKVMETEPLYLFGPSGMIVADIPLSIDVASGKIVENGDFTFTIKLGKERGEFGPDYDISLEAHGGAGFVLTDEDFPSLAPEDGYRTTLTMQIKASDPDYQLSQNIRFYAKTRSGKYALIGVVISAPRTGAKGDFEAGIRYNPNGSRNMEFDQKNWINR